VLADLARIEVQREDQVASELLVLLRLACDRLNTNQFRTYELDALRTPKTTTPNQYRRGLSLTRSDGMSRSRQGPSPEATV
ncbi:hypothetical protein V7S43_000452, partial [Phytophthora oleae]